MNKLMELIKKKVENIFSFDKIGNCLKLNILCFKISFRLPFKKKNYFISLGKNCFIRMIFTKYGLKPRKKDGELSCPFDLCLSTHETVATLLENNFENILESIVYNTQHQCWENKIYSILYLHYKDATLDEIKEKINRHVNNFRNITHNSPDLKYFITCYNNEFSVNTLNRIYNALCKLRGGKHFKFYILNFIDKYSPDNNISSLHKDIIYNEYDVLDFEKFFEKWHLLKYSNPDLFKNIFNNIK